MGFSAEEGGRALIVGGYAIVDLTKGSTSEGKILVLLDDEEEALEIANELRRRGCSVAVRMMRRRRPDPIRSATQAGVAAAPVTAIVAS
jgi:hypothetical protein